MNVRIITISIDNDMLTKIDKKRGLIPRSAFIQEILGNSKSLGVKK